MHKNELNPLHGWQSFFKGQDSEYFSFCVHHGLSQVLKSVTEAFLQSVLHTRFHSMRLL